MVPSSSVCLCGLLVGLWSCATSTVDTDAAVPDAAVQDQGGGEDAQPACNRRDAGLCGFDLGQSECEAVGGQWGGSALRAPFCNCPTSDGNCPCQASDECESFCQGNRVNPGQSLCEPASFCHPLRIGLGCLCVAGPWSSIPANETRMICLD